MAIAAGLWHSLALKSSGTVIAWGCGYPTLDAGQCTVPPAAQSGVIAIAGGAYHSLALKRDGSVVAWGCGTIHQSHADTVLDWGQCDVPAAAKSGVTAIAAGTQSSLALNRDGRVVAWGCRVSRGREYCTVPAAAKNAVTAVAPGMVLKRDGGVVAWGCCGKDRVPTAARSGVVAIAAGKFQDLALKNDGSVVAWGCHSPIALGQCRDSVATRRSGVTGIAAGSDYNLALLGSP